MTKKQTEEIQKKNNQLGEILAIALPAYAYSFRGMQFMLEGKKKSQELEFIYQHMATIFEHYQNDFKEILWKIGIPNKELLSVLEQWKENKDSKKPT